MFRDELIELITKLYLIKDQNEKETIKKQIKDLENKYKKEKIQGEYTNDKYKRK